MNDYMTTPFEFDDLAYLAVPLPEEIAALHRQGRFGEESAGKVYCRRADR